jgi:ketosteroid isomerase-like protein
MLDESKLDSQARLQILLDKQELLELVTRYCRAVDRCDMELLLSCFHDDAIDEHGTFSGRPIDTFPAILERLVNEPPTQHVISNSLFQVEGDVAFGEIYTGVRTSNAQGRYQPGGFGRQIDRYERREGQWRIAHRKVVIEWFDPGPDRELPRFDTGSKNRDDPSYR